jgi:membrane-bound lytic murein transglycosylase C
MIRKNLKYIKLDKYIKTPYFFNNIKYKNKKIKNKNIANQYIDYLMKHNLKWMLDKNKKVYFIDINYYGTNLSKLTKLTNINNNKMNKIKKLVNKYSIKFNIKKDLIYSIIKTESDFNDKAINSVPAVGLMQIVPRTAGNDSYRRLYNRNIIPSINYLFNIENNIKHGIHYLSILDKIYLKDIKNYKKRELCMIASYNGGVGNLLRTFDNNKSIAINKINKYSYNKLYKYLIKNLPYKETRNYLYKVNRNLKKLN